MCAAQIILVCIRQSRPKTHTSDKSPSVLLLRTGRIFCHWAAVVPLAPGQDMAAQAHFAVPAECWRMFLYSAPLARDTGLGRRIVAVVAYRRLAVVVHRRLAVVVRCSIAGAVAAVVAHYARVRNSPS
jgi:hypothetical protein